MGRIWKVVVVVCIALATAHAKPLALEPHDVGGVSVSTPKGWAFTGDATVIMDLSGPHRDNDPITKAMFTSPSYESHTYTKQR